MDADLCHVAGIQILDMRQRAFRVMAAFPQPFQARRCVIPMSLFYEWGPVSGARGGRKQGHQIRDPADDWLWAAGLWEVHP